MAHNYSQAFNELANGSIFRSTNTLYETQVGLGDWWIVLIYLVTLMIAYTVSKKHHGVVAALGIVAGGFLAYKGQLMPDAQMVMYMLVVFNLAMLLFNVFRNKER